MPNTTPRFIPNLLSDDGLEIDNKPISIQAQMTVTQGSE